MQFGQISFHLPNKSGLSGSNASSQAKYPNVFEFSSDKEHDQAWT